MKNTIPFLGARTSNEAILQGLVKNELFFIPPSVSEAIRCCIAFELVEDP
jgi:hypothetical protein